MPNITISGLPPAILPLDDPNTLFEVTVLEAGEEVSRRISLADIATSTGLDASFITVGANAQLPNERVLTAGTNISIVDGGAGSTITINSTAAAAPVDSVFGRTGAVVALEADYDAFYLVKAAFAAQTVVGDVQFDGKITFTDVSGVQFDPSVEIDMRNPADDTTFFMQYVAAGVAWGLAGADFNSVFMDFGSSFTHFRFGDPIFITERSAAEADVTALGQFWVRDDVPNVAMFTDDAGTDFVLNGVGGVPDPLLLSDGTAGAPTYSFASNPTTGVYLVSPDILGLSAGGLRVVQAVELGGTVQLQAEAGTAAVPSYSFRLSPSSGLFTVSSNRPGISSSGLVAQDWQTIASHAITTSETDIIAASTTQTQGNGQLLSSYNVVTPVANANDVVTMPVASVGKRVVVINSGANVLQLFPSLGDDLGAGVNASITLAVGVSKIFLAEDGVTWATSGESGVSGGPGGVLPLGTVSEASLKWNGVDAWIEETQIRLTAGSTGITILDAGLTDNIRIGHDGANALVRTTGSAEVIFGGGGAGPTTAWRFEQMVRVPDGSAALPGITFFGGGITTGWFRNASGLSASITTVEQLRISGATTEIYSDRFILAPNIGVDRITLAVSPPTDANDFVMTMASLTDFHILGVGAERFVLEELNLAMVEKSAAPGDVAGTGQFWVRDDAPNTAMFTNDAGVDKSLVNDAVQARRTTDYTITTAFADVTLDTTDVETDSAVLDHDLVTNTDNIIVGQPGTYEITYGADIDPLASGNENIRCFGRVRINDAGVDIPGSLASTSAFEDGSVDGDFVFSRLQCSFIVTLAASDFLTLQLMKVELTAPGTFTAEEVTVTAKRLL